MYILGHLHQRCAYVLQISTQCALEVLANLTTLRAFLEILHLDQCKARIAWLKANQVPSFPPRGQTGQGAMHVHVLICKLGTPHFGGQANTRPNDAGTLEPSPNATESADKRTQYSIGF